MDQECLRLNGKWTHLFRMVPPYLGHWSVHNEAQDLSRFPFRAHPDTHRHTQTRPHASSSASLSKLEPNLSQTWANFCQLLLETCVNLFLFLLPWDLFSERGFWVSHSALVEFWFLWRASICVVWSCFEPQERKLEGES